MTLRRRGALGETREGRSEAAYRRGLRLVERGEWFAAHEELEAAWRAAEPAERYFLQGLVHVAVAWYHAEVTGRARACESQLRKASRRLAPYAPQHRGVDVAALLASLEAARGRFPNLPRPRFRETRTRG
jgi:predicted metal-dependent hydrolase